MRKWLVAALAACTVAGHAAPPAVPSSAAPVEKTFRYAFLVAETGFDPAKINDLYSRIVTSHIYESLYKYDYLAWPSKVVPGTADGMAEASADFRTWTVRIKPGIYFQDDPAFQGKPRELVAADYVYAFKRFFDPVNKSPNYSGLKEEGFLGADDLREAAIKSKKPFDYDTEIEGLKAIDRYTIRFSLAKPRPRFLYTLADSSLFGAVAREVVETYGDKTAEHPVGTGPFRLGPWRRSSRIVMLKNPTFRDVRWDAQPNADDAEGQAMLARMKGRRLPLVDRVEIAIIEESQPRWLSFLNGDFDILQLPLDFASQAVPGGKLAPYLQKRGVGLDRYVAPDITLFYFNMEDPVVGGYTPEKVALRRAIALATDTNREIRGVRRGQAIPAQSTVNPGAWGYDPTLKTANSDFDPASANALLDLYGYVDKDGDGWRDLPDGKPLVIEYATQPDALSRQFDELWKRNMDAIRVKLKIGAAQWPEQLKAARAGKLMVWQLGYSSASPDVQESLQILYGPAAGGQNLGRFKEPRFDEIYRRMQDIPDGPERLVLLREALLIVQAYQPQKYNVHRIQNYLYQPRVRGFRYPRIGREFWQYVDVDGPAPSAAVVQSQR